MVTGRQMLERKARGNGGTQLTYWHCLWGARRWPPCRRQGRAFPAWDTLGRTHPARCTLAKCSSRDAGLATISARSRCYHCCCSLDATYEWLGTCHPTLPPCSGFRPSPSAAGRTRSIPPRPPSCPTLTRLRPRSQSCTRPSPPGIRQHFCAAKMARSRAIRDWMHALDDDEKREWPRKARTTSCMPSICNKRHRMSSRPRGGELTMSTSSGAMFAYLLGWHVGVVVVGSSHDTDRREDITAHAEREREDDGAVTGRAEKLQRSQPTPVGV